MRELIVMVIIAMFIGMAGAEDFVKATDVIAKDVRELGAEEINLIFEGDTWFMSGGPSMYTPSQNAFLRNNEGEGKGLGGKPLLLGSINKYTLGTLHYFTPSEFNRTVR
jgi:hypothetical protein